MSLQPGTDVVLAVEKPVVGGRMLARHEGQVVFVAGSIPGERVRARIERVGKGLAYAEAVDVLTASTDRRASNVDWACGGSLYAHITYKRQLTLKSELISDSFLRIGKMTLPAAVPVMASEEHGYRMRARLHIRNGRFGFFREGTHDLCEAASTGQLLPATIESVRDLEAALAAKGISSVAACELLENMSASERAILLELQPSHSAPLDMRPIESVTGLVFTDHQSARLTVGYGSPFVTDELKVSGASPRLTHHVQSFFQGNRYLLPQLVSQTLVHIPEGQVIDLYAGVGLFAVSLAAAGHSNIIAVEGDRSSARDLEHNAAPYFGAVDVKQISVENFLRQKGTRTPTTVVVDPPRTGISREAMSGISALKPPRVVYVSCDLATIARDVKRFAEAGYELRHIEAFDLFPNTAHVETLVVLTRSG
jgi:23S rRNA (uracil1939-C5)-methyltransferase